MLVSLAAPAATTARATLVRATARRVAPRSSFAPKAIPALPARRFARARVARRVVAIDAIPHVRAVARRAAPLRRATRVRAASAGAPGAFDDEKRGPNAFVAMLVAAVLAGAALAFAYGEFEPLIGAVNADKLAPAQDIARAAFVTAKSSAAIAGDAAVELVLDAYDAAVLLAAHAQDALANLGAGLSAAGGATGIKAAGSVSPLLDPATPLGSFLTSLVGGAAYFADAAANGQWAKILCYKPFKTVAAVTLTVLRIGVSWFLSGAEFACSMLYATPAYAAAIAVVALVALRKVVKSAAKTTTRRAEAAPTSAASPPVAADAAESEVSGATETEADETEPAVVEKPVPMPASAVFEASTRVMTEEEKAIMLRRVREAKSTTRTTTSFASESYENSYASSSSSYDASSSSAYGASVSVDASDVDRIYKELTQKYGVESGAAGKSGAYAVVTPLPASLPTASKSSAFDADAFLAAFATDDSSSASYTAAASATEAKYAVTTSESSIAGSAVATSSTTTTETKSATKSASATSSATSSTPVSTSATSSSPSPAASASSSAASSDQRVVSRDKLDMSKVRFDKVGGFLGKAVKAAAESATPAAKDAWRETVELTKVVVPSVPKLLEGSVSNIGKESGKKVTAAAAKSVQVKASTDGAEVTVAAVAAADSAETVVETTTTETTVTETTVTETVEETAEATFESSTSIESMEESGTVWKKKKTD